METSQLETNARIQAASYVQARIEAALRSSSLDALIAVSPENVQYTAGVWIATQRTIPDRLALVVWPKGGPQTLIVCNIEESFCRAHSWIPDIRTYVEHKESPMALLASGLSEKGMGRGRIGIEMGYLSARYWTELEGHLPNAVIEPCEAVFAEARLVKSKGEIALLGAASVATERALLATYLCIRPGDSERLMAQRLAANLLAVGADSVPFLHMPAGMNTCYPHPSATDYRIRSGDLVKTDFGGLFSGYYSDRARTMVLGKPTADQESMYSRLVEVHRETIQTARPGTSSRQVYQVAREGYRRLKIPFDPPHAGHSIGVAVHEPPMLNDTFDVPLAPQMIFAIETRMRLPGQYGMHIEDLVEIGEHGPVVHTANFPFESLLSV